MCECIENYTIVHKGEVWVQKEKYDELLKKYNESTLTACDMVDIATVGIIDTVRLADTSEIKHE